MKSPVVAVISLLLIGVTGCQAPGTPAPVASSDTPASQAAWIGEQSDQPVTPSSGDTAPSASSSASPSTSTSSSEPTGDAQRSQAHHPGVGGQPLAQVGECVNLTRAQDGHTTFSVIDCAQPHDAQVVGFVDLTDGPNAPAPSLGRFQQLAATHCPILGSELLGSPLGQRQDLTVNWTGPAKREWTQGARSIVCMISGSPKADGSGTQPVTGDIRSGITQGQPAPPPAPAPAPAVQPAPAAN